MGKREINIAEAKKHFSDIIGRVAYGKKPILITKRGRPVARIVPLEGKGGHLADVKGWLDQGDEFFTIMETIVSNRRKHIPRAVRSRV